MDTAVALTSSNANAVAAPGNFGARLAALPVRSKLSIGAGLAALAAVVLAMTLWSSQGDYKVLFANVTDKDGGAIIAQLTQLNIPYRYSEGGGAILVPAAKLHDAKLKLALAGLPKGNVGGFEMMDSARFGQTQFQERLTFQRGLEGELVRSITSMAAVEGARVHLALPNQNGFFREQQKPSASVMLTLHAGRTLDAGQVAGIVHLVASSVPEMSPKAVSVLDQTGALLSQPPESNSGAGLDAQQLQYKAKIENDYTKRIFELLEPVVGRENLRANVTADVDFSQTEATSEEFKPNQGQGAAPSVRSQQTSEQSGGAGSGAPATGIPGAASNQPPQSATAPIVGASAPLQTAQGGAGSGAGGGSSRRENVTNFEVDKTVRVTRNATGTVKRLNAAVVVNSPSVTDAKGKTKPVPLTPEELDKLTTLVQESIGFSKDRGDSVKVINAPFKVQVVDNADVPLWKNPDLLDLLRAALVPAALLGVALLVFFGMIRPGLKAAFPPPPSLNELAVAGEGAGGAGGGAGGAGGGFGPDGVRLSGPGGAGGANGNGQAGNNVNTMVAGDEALPGLPGPGMKALEGPETIDQQLEKVRVMARSNPAAVATILSGWVSGGDA